MPTDKNYVFYWLQNATVDKLCGGMPGLRGHMAAACLEGDTGARAALADFLRDLPPITEEYSQFLEKLAIMIAAGEWECDSTAVYHKPPTSVVQG